jgi:hypothetical protein
MGINYTKIKRVTKKIDAILSLIFLIIGIIGFVGIFYGYIILNNLRITEFLVVPVQNIMAKTSNDPLVDSIVDSCNITNSSIKKIRCVENYFDEYYFYNKRVTFDAKDLFNNGGDCKSSVYVAKKILDGLNIKSSLKTLDGHEILIIDFQDGFIIFSNGEFEWNLYEGDTNE